MKQRSCYKFLVLWFPRKEVYFTQMICYFDVASTLKSHLTAEWIVHVRQYIKTHGSELVSRARRFVCGGGK